MPEIFIIATRNCTHAPNLQREPAEAGRLWPAPRPAARNTTWSRP